MTTSELLAEQTIRQCVETPGITGAVIFPTHVRRAEWLSQRYIALRDAGAVAVSNREVRFPNGSKLHLIVLARDEGTDKLRGLEIQFYDEGPQPNLTPEQWDYLRTRVRR